MLDPNKLTYKSQEALMNAQKIAQDTMREVRKKIGVR